LKKSIKPPATSIQIPSIPPPKISPAKEVATSSICVVCDGEVRPLSREKVDGTFHIIVIEGAYCSYCGIKYEFMPPKNLKIMKKSKKFNP